MAGSVEVDNGERIWLPKWVARIVLTAIIAILSASVATVYARIGELERRQIKTEVQIVAFHGRMDDTIVRLTRIEGYLLRALGIDKHADKLAGGG